MGTLLGVAQASGDYEQMIFSGKVQSPAIIILDWPME